MNTLRSRTEEIASVYEVLDRNRDERFIGRELVSDGELVELEELDAFADQPDEQSERQGDLIALFRSQV